MTVVTATVRSGRRLLAALLVAAGVLLLAAAPADAHAALVATSPRQGARLETAPTEVLLQFGEAVGLNRRSVQVFDSAGRRVDVGSSSHPIGDDRDVAARLRTGLAPGSYLVLWRVVSADSHPVAGSFTFGYRAPASAAPSVSSGPAGPLAVVRAVLEWANLAGAVVLVGASFFVLVLWPPGWLVPRTRRIAVTAWAVCLAGTAGLLLVEGAYGSSGTLADVTDPALLRLTLGSAYGRLLLLRLVALVASAAVWWPVRGGRGTPRRFDAVGVGLLVVESFGFAGHAGQGSWVLVTATVDALHLVAASVWLGGLVVLVAALLPQAVRAAEGSPVDAGAGEGVQVLHHWSDAATVAVVVLAGTGATQAWRGIGDPGALLGTRYGLLVVGKVAVLGGLLGLAAYGRHRVLRARAGAGLAPGLRRLRRSVAAEVALGAAALALTAVLVDTVPGAQSYAPAYRVALTGRDTEGRTIVVRVTVTPPRTGAQSLSVTAADADGRPVRVASVSGDLTAPALGLGPIRFDAVPAGTGTARADGVAVPAPGRWTLVVRVRTDAFTEYAASTSYEVG